MDPITQGVLGAACAQVVLHRSYKDKAWLVGGLAGMAPDLDIIIRTPNDPLLFFLYHRHFTHSIFFIPFGALLITLLLLPFKSFRESWKLTFLAAFIGYATHGLLDACTSYGTVLYWPFSDRRVSWDLISIIDPFFTLPLLLGLLWTIVNNKRTGVMVGLALAGLFLLFNSVQHHRAYLAAQRFANENHMAITKLRVWPELARSVKWQGIGISNQRIVRLHIATPLTQRAKANFLADYPLLSVKQIPDYIRQSPTLWRDLNLFNWFSDGYSILAKTQPFILADGRFMDNSAKTALWACEFLPGQKHIRQINFLKLGQ
jgi:inner membrane protein